MTDRIIAYINNDTLSGSDTSFSLTTPRKVITWQDSAGPVNITGAVPVAYAGRAQRQVELIATVLDAAAGQVLVTWDAGTLTEGQWSIDHRITIGGVTSGVRWTEHVIASIYVPPSGEPVFVAAGTITQSGTGPVTLTFTPPTYTGTEPITVALAATLGGSALTVTGGTATVERTLAVQAVSAVWTLDGPVGDPLVTAPVTLDIAAATAPTASLAPTLTPTGATTMTATLAADQANGGSAITDRTIVITVNGTPITSVTGLAAEATHTITGLSAGDTVVARVDVTNAAGTTAGATATATTADPTLTLPAATGGAGTIDARVTTDAPNVALSLVVVASGATAPSAAQIIAGQDATGSAAVASATIASGAVSAGENVFAQISGLSAGGYDVHFAQGLAAPVTAAVTVAEIFPPVLLVMIGQSNSVGYAADDAGTVPPTSNAFMLANDNTWVAMQSRPKHGTWSPEAVTREEDSVNAVFGAEREFLIAYRAANPDVPQYTIGVADGSTSFNANNWNPGDTLYNNAVARINAGIAAMPTPPGEIVFLNILGESDAAANNEAAYNAARNALVDGVRSDVTGATNAIWLECTQGGTQDPSWRDTQIQNAQRSIEAQLPYTSTVTAPFLASVFDGTHFNAATQRLFGTAAYRQLPVARANTAVTRTLTPSLGTITRAALGGGTTGSMSATMNADATAVFVVLFARSNFLSSRTNVLTIDGVEMQAMHFYSGGLAIGYAPVTGGDTVTIAYSASTSFNEGVLVAIPVINGKASLSNDLGFASQVADSTNLSVSTTARDGDLLLSLAFTRFTTPSQSADITAGADTVTTLTDLPAAYSAQIGVKAVTADGATTISTTNTSGTTQVAMNALVGIAIPPSA